MDKIENFTLDLLQKEPEVLKEIIGDTDVFEELNSTGVSGEVVEMIHDYLLENSNILDEYKIEHEGGDSSIYDDGLWVTELRESHGWYYWIEPEGRVYGLYSSLEESLKIRDHL